MSDVSLTKNTQENPTEDAAEEVAEVYKPYKVFINHVDSYHSKYIAAVTFPKDYQQQI